MSNRFDIVYPPSGRITFDGGKNNKFERALIADNESPDCFNVVFTDGAVETRGGSTKLNTTAVGSFAFDGLYTRRDSSNAETMVAFAGGTAWQLAGSTFTTIPSAQSVFTAGVQACYAEYQDYMFVGNGYVTPYKYDGTNWTRHGVPAATGTVSTASQATGVLTGDYRYKVTYVNSASVEGDVGTSTVTITAASATIRLSSIPTAPQSHGVAARRIYRTEAGGSTWKRLTEISNNTTTTYDDNTADSGLGANAPTDQGEPPKYSVICYHQNRLFCNDLSNPNYVWYSELGEPFTFKATNFLRVGDASSDLVKGLDVYGNHVLVRCEKSCHIILMPTTDDADWGIVRLPVEFGSRSPFGAWMYNGKMAFPAMQNSKIVGFPALSGSSIDPDVTALESNAIISDYRSKRIEPDVFEIQEAYVDKIAAIVYKNKAYIALTYGNGNTTNNRIYMFDFSRTNMNKKQEESWVPFTGINASRFTIYDGKLYYGSSTATGFVYQLETDTYVDDSSAINSYFWTKEFSGNKGHENLVKDFKYVRMLIEKSGAYYMNLTYRVDSDAGVGKTIQVDLDPGGSIWGTMMWGRDSWGGGTAQEEPTVFIGSAQGKRIQFRFSNQNAAGQKFKVLGLNFNYNIKGKR